MCYRYKRMPSKREASTICIDIDHFSLRQLWDMFHFLRFNSGLCYFFALLFMFIAQSDNIRSDRHNNIAFSALQQITFQAAGMFFLSESFALFRAVTSGVLGGKGSSYAFFSYGTSLILFGLTLYLYPEDYGRDPRAFIGWENDTKRPFFFSICICSGLCLLLSLIVVINMTTPKLRREYLVDQFTPIGHGMTLTATIFAMIWGFAYPAFMRHPDIEILNFYPIFVVLNSWFGVIFVFALILGSKRFRMIVLCKERRKNPYEVDEDFSDTEDAEAACVVAQPEVDESQADGGEEGAASTADSVTSGEVSDSEDSLDNDSTADGTTTSDETSDGSDSDEDEDEEEEDDDKVTV